MASDLNVQTISRSISSLEPFTRTPLNSNAPLNTSEKAPVRHTAPGSRESPTFLNSDELKNAVEQLDKLARLVRHELQFSVDETSGRLVIKVIDMESNEVIRQVPPEEVLDLIARFEDFKSVLVSAEA
jgi:flagellar protein FlaG